ncbi:MAG TPA: uroporphyrinogen-III synthase, partial [Steroidobacteraceae bacterium]
QLYGAEPNLPLIEFLTGAGAQVATVAPYLYADAASEATVLDLLERMRAGEVDAIAFTSKAQVERLFRAAPADAVRAALAATHVGAVGPVVSATLASYGVAVNAMPDSSWFMKPLTASLAELLTR